MSFNSRKGDPCPTTSFQCNLYYERYPRYSPKTSHCARLERKTVVLVKRSLNQCIYISGNIRFWSGGACGI